MTYLTYTSFNLGNKIPVECISEYFKYRSGCVPEWEFILGMVLALGLGVLVGISLCIREKK